MDNRPIGVFDSGLGGLTAVKELMRQLPDESIVYFGDTGRVPYGTRSNETIVKYVKQDIRFLLNFDIKIIIIACGTASAVALQQVQSQFSIPIIGVVQPSVQRAVKATQNKKIAIIGTPGTINSNAYAKKIAEIDPEIKTFSTPCPMFVPLVENGYIDDQVATLVAEEYLKPLREEGVDTLIMGCTHYPLLRKTIAETMGEGVRLIDPGAETAKHVKQILQHTHQLSDNRQQAHYQYYVSDSVEGFSRLGSMFLEKEINDSVEKIDIEKY